ncbi:MAG: RnfABCDGE type electron transport complex subunit C [Spirochaetes bacterium]|nr:RnfABCDGE type electron transport complex subunit C [Spirochaetota bacterium]
MNRIFRLPKGGLYLPSQKEVVKGFPIRNAVLPPIAVVPLVQSDGNEVTRLVQVGDFVQEGVLIGKGKGKHSLHIHASIPGTVQEIRPIPLPRGIEAPAVFIELGGEFDRLGKKEVVYPWRSLSHRELKNLLIEKGVVDGNFPLDGPIELLIINGMELEPYLCSEYRLLMERSDAILEGIRILQKLLDPARTLVVLEDKALDVQVSLGASLRNQQIQGTEGASGKEIELVLLEGKYPAGDPEQLVNIFFHQKVTPKRTLGEMGVTVIDIATTFAVYEGVALRKPLMERVITVSGKAIRRPANLKVRIGTPILDIIEECGGLTQTPVKVVCGGPFRGYGIFDLRTPVTREMSGILFLTKDEIHPGVRTSCINCGNCLEVCPEGLHPSRLFKWIDHGYFNEALEDSLLGCTECGCCAFVCPSRIPLVQGFQVGKVHAARVLNGRSSKDQPNG